MEQSHAHIIKGPVDPANGARDMTTALNKAGFGVVLGMDRDKRNIEDAILQFGRKLKTDGTGLFYSFLAKSFYRVIGDGPVWQSLSLLPRAMIF